jgi:hypothetical protein
MVERIFLHSSFRSGSTWFWARFRAASGVCAFYEPFHEQKADLTPLALADDRADGWASGHPDLDAPYNLEYMPLLAPPKGVPFYRRRFAYEDYYATGQDPQEKAYIDFLVGHAERSGKRAVLGFKRSFGRLRRLKAQCGGVHLVTLRNPWDQWVSFAEQMQSSNHYFSFRIYLIACVANWSGHASFLEGLPLFSPTGDYRGGGRGVGAVCLFLAAHHRPVPSVPESVSARFPAGDPRSGCRRRSRPFERRRGLSRRNDRDLAAGHRAEDRLVFRRLRPAAPLAVGGRGLSRRADRGSMP